MGCKEEAVTKAGRGQITHQNYVDRNKKIMCIVALKSSIYHAKVTCGQHRFPNCLRCLGVKFNTF